MRIIAGRYRGKRLVAPDGAAIRPTGARAREALFNILAHGKFSSRPVYEDAIVLDAFAGTGALGLEALSRGARYATFMEKDRQARAALTSNIEAMGVKSGAAVMAADALKPPRSAAPASLAFLDPPYGEDLAGPALTSLALAGWFAPGALAVAEIPAKRGFIVPDGFDLLDERRYGAAKILFVRYAL
jgi:16S rRNA (guanine966-N2)-methyltransferase